jgi:hypothetical protein
MLSPRSDREGPERGTIGFDGIQSPGQLEAGDRIGDDARVRSRSPTAGADLRFARPAGDVATFDINGMRCSDVGAGVRFGGSRAAEAARWRGLSGRAAQVTARTVIPAQRGIGGSGG